MIQSDLGQQAERQAFLAALRADDQAWRTACADRLAYYRCDADAYDTHLVAYIAALVENERHRTMLRAMFPPPRTLGYVVELIAGVYNDPPKRALARGGTALDDDAPESQIAASMAEALALDATLMEADRIRALLRTCYLWAQWDPLSVAPQLTVVYPHQVYAEPHPSYPTRVQTCRWIAVEVETDASAYAPLVYTRPARVFHLYRREDPAVVDSPVLCEVVDERGVLYGEQPYPDRLPDYPLVRVDDRPCTTWQATGDDDLLREPLAAAFALALQAYAQEFSAFPQLTANLDPDEARSLQIGPGTILSARDLVVSYLQPDFDFGRQQQVIQDRLKAWAITRYVPAQTFDFTGQVASGAALRALSQPQLKMWERRQQAWVRGEAELWRVLAQVREAGLAAGGYATPDEAWQTDPADLASTRLRATFAPPKAPMLPEEETAQLQVEAAMGLVDLGQVLIDRGEFGPDELEAARAAVVERKRMAAPRAAGTPADDATADIVRRAMTERSTGPEV